VNHVLHTTSTRQTTHQDSVSKWFLRRIFFHKFCLWRIVFTKKSYLQCIEFRSRIFLSVGHLISVCSLFYWFSTIENDSNSNAQWSQGHNLLKTAMKKVSNNKPLVRSNLVRYKLHNTNSIPKQFIKKECTSSHETSISQLLGLSWCFHSRARRRLRANTSHRIKQSSGWYRWSPSSLQSPTISYGECWVHKHPVVRMRRIELVIVGWVVWILTDTVEEKRFYWHNSSHSPWPCVTPWRWIANIFGKQRVSLRGVYVWDIKSTVTKHSDYLLWFYWLSLLETVV